MAETLLERQSSDFAGRMGAKGIVIIVPAGKCPVPLTSTDEQTVITWCEEVLDKGLAEGRIFSPSALAYFARYYFDIHSADYKQVCKVIYQWGEIDRGEQETITYEPRRTQSYESFIKPKQSEPIVAAVSPDNGLEGMGKATIQFEE